MVVDERDPGILEGEVAQTLQPFVDIQVPGPDGFEQDFELLWIHRERDSLQAGRMVYNSNIKVLVFK